MIGFAGLPQGEIAPRAIDKPYFPFIAARERGIFDEARLKKALESFQVMLQRSSRAHNVATSTVIPNHKGAGIVRLPDGTIGAVDHVSAEVQGAGIYTTPSEKNAVDKISGRISGPGLKTLTTPDMAVRILSCVVDMCNTYPWDQEEVFTWQAASGRELAALAPWSSDSTMRPPMMRIYDYDPDTGEQLLIPEQPTLFVPGD